MATPHSYTRTLATATRMVAKYGRGVTLLALDKTPSDPLKPHLGPLDPRATPSATLASSAVFLEPSAADKLGVDISKLDFVKRSEQLAVMAVPADVEDYDELLEADGSYWRIVGSSKFVPGSTTLLHFVGVAR